VLNLFDQPQLNHHTELVGGVLADQCGRVLQDFFAERRLQYRQRRALPAGDTPASIPTGEAVELSGLPASELDTPDTDFDTELRAP
jgi:tRNA(adenine34) deaminase